MWSAGWRYRRDAIIKVVSQETCVKVGVGDCAVAGGSRCTGERQARKKKPLVVMERFGQVEKKKGLAISVRESIRGLVDVGREVV